MCEVRNILFRRIIKSSRLEKTYKIIKSKHQLIYFDTVLGSFKSRTQMKEKVMEKDICCSHNILYKLLYKM